MRGVEVGGWGVGGVRGGHGSGWEGGGQDMRVMVVTYS